MDLTWLLALVAGVAAHAGPVAPPAPVAVPTGPPPAVAYAVATHPTFGGGDWRLVRPDGTSRPFSQNTGQFVAYHDLVVNGYGTEAGAVVELYDGAPHLQHEQDGLCSYRLLTTPDRSEVAYLQNDGSLVELHGDGSVDTRPVDLPDGPCGAAQPVALRASKLYVDAPRTPPSVLAGAGHPAPLRLLSDLADVSDAGLLVGRLADPRCSGLLRPRHGVRWQTCTDRLTTFSPGGRHVLGVVGSSLPKTLVVHRVRTGRVELTWSAAAHQRIEQVEWEDAGHLLAVVHGPAVGWSVLRLGLDGSEEYAVAPVRTGAEFPPFRLPLG